MQVNILDAIDSWQTRLEQERSTRALLVHCAGPDVRDLKFRKQSHNAVVFEGTLEGAVVFLKRYETDYGPTLVRIGVEETTLVRGQMDGKTAGLAQIIWASEDGPMVLMAAVPGGPVAAALSGAQVGEVMEHVAQWLVQYIGPRTYDDTFSPKYWVKKRSAEDLSDLSAPDQSLVAQTLDLQRARHREHGAMPATKGRYPKDFAPHNLHWTGTAIWGFDIEGYTTNPVARAIARFCVLAERRVPPDCDRRFGVHAQCLGAFQDAFELPDDHPVLLPFLIADELLNSLVRRHDDPVAGPAIRRALHAHLAQA